MWRRNLEYDEDFSGRRKYRWWTRTVEEEVNETQRRLDRENAIYEESLNNEDLRRRFNELKAEILQIRCLMSSAETTILCNRELLKNRFELLKKLEAALSDYLKKTYNYEEVSMSETNPRIRQLHYNDYCKFLDIRFKDHLRECIGAMQDYHLQLMTFYGAFPEVSAKYLKYMNVLKVNLNSLEGAIQCETTLCDSLMQRAYCAKARQARLQVDVLKEREANARPQQPMQPFLIIKE